MLQAITGVRPQIHRAKKHHAQFGIRAGKAISLTSTLRGDMAYEFVDKCVNLVFPKRKDWTGVEGTTGDNNGNISFGFDRDSASLFPEVEVNYDVSFVWLTLVINIDQSTDVSSQDDPWLPCYHPYHGKFGPTSKTSTWCLWRSVHRKAG